MLIRTLGLRALVLLAILTPATLSAETWYAERITTGEAPLRVDHFWSSGARLRAETVVAGHPILTLVSGDRYLVIDRLGGRGISIRRSPAAIAADAARMRPFGLELERMRAVGAEVVGSQRLGSRRCQLWRVTDPTGRRELCVSDDAAQLPFEMTVWSRATGRSVVVRYLDWTRDLALPDAFFEPDPRVRIESYEYEEYVRKTAEGPVGPAPPFFAELLHGTPPTRD